MGKKLTSAPKRFKPGTRARSIKNPTEPALCGDLLVDRVPEPLRRSAKTSPRSAAPRSRSLVEKRVRPAGFGNAWSCVLGCAKGYEYRPYAHR